MNPDHVALFAAVLANPDDDLPRLVFADYLEESGDPASAARAAYIRGQIEAESHAPGTDARLKLNRRLADMRDRFRDEWDRAFSRPDDWHGFRVERRRGFVDEVSVGLTRFTQIGRRMFAAAPVRVLRLTDGGEPEEWANFAEADFLGTLRELRLGPRMMNLLGTTDTARKALAMARLPGLRRLDLSDNGFTDRSLTALAFEFLANGFPPELVELDLSKNHAGDPGVRFFLGVPGVDKLERIDLRWNRLIPVLETDLRKRFGDRVVM
jgi:uncharacterized protein (TIGR02996 family)